MAEKGSLWCNEILLSPLTSTGRKEAAFFRTFESLLLKGQSLCSKMNHNTSNFSFSCEDSYAIHKIRYLHVSLLLLGLHPFFLLLFWVLGF